MKFTKNDKVDGVIFLIAVISYWLGAIYFGINALHDVGLLNDANEGAFDEPDFLRGVFGLIFVASLVVMWAFFNHDIKPDDKDGEDEI